MIEADKTDEVQLIGDLKLDHIIAWLNFALVFKGSIKGFQLLKQTLNRFLKENQDEIMLVYMKGSMLPLLILANKGNMNFKENFEK